MFKDISVLYVEDNKEVRESIAYLLVTFFKELFTAKNGRDGLETYKKNQDNIDIIITDINMPKLNGIDMAKEIRNINPNLPIIITSGHNENKFLYQAIEIGVTGFIVKPINIKTLIDLIKKHTIAIILQRKLEKEQKEHYENLIKDARYASIGQLIGGITHEINTPLTFAKGNLEMLKYDIEDIKEEKIQTILFQDLNQIENGIQRIENIVNSMKELSQKSSSTKCKKFNIYSTIIIASTLLSNKINNISKIYINGKLFNVDMDKNEFIYEAIIQINRIEQVWMIIINNELDELMKIDNFQDRRLDIDIKLNDNKIIVIFKDNGGGIEESILDRIFEPFKGTKPSSGMGIGLSIAKNIIDEHPNITITAYNDGKNACFEIKFDLVENK
jgi:signal transduction histidine kinase